MPVQGQTTPYLDVTDTDEMVLYGFPDPNNPATPDCDKLDAGTVFRASVMIDAYLNRTMAKTQYVERYRLPRNRNIAKLLHPPVLVADISELKGRIIYGRRSDTRLNQGRTVLFGAIPVSSGVPQFQPIAVSECELNEQTGEIYIPYSPTLGAYGEIEVTYQGGYDAAAIPSEIKAACAMICKSELLRTIPDIGSMNLPDISINYVNPTSGPSIISQDARDLLAKFQTWGLG